MISRKSPTVDHVGLKLFLEDEETPVMGSPSGVFGEKWQDGRSFFRFFFHSSFWSSGPQDRHSGSSEVYHMDWTGYGCWWLCKWPGGNIKHPLLIVNVDLGAPEPSSMLCN